MYVASLPISFIFLFSIAGSPDSIIDGLPPMETLGIFPPPGFPGSILSLLFKIPLLYHSGKGHPSIMLEKDLSPDLPGHPLLV